MEAHGGLDAGSGCSEAKERSGCAGVGSREIEIVKKKSAEFESFVAHASVREGAAVAGDAVGIQDRSALPGRPECSPDETFKAATDRWTKVIIGDVPSVVDGGELIDDLLIESQGVPIDGPGGILGQESQRNRLALQACVDWLR